MSKLEFRPRFRFYTPLSVASVSEKLLSESKETRSSNLIRHTIRKEFLKHFPNPERISKRQKGSPYDDIVAWFSEHSMDLDNDADDSTYRKELSAVTPLIDFIQDYMPDLEANQIPLMAEFVLHALAEYSLISKKSYHGRVNFNDMLGSMFS